MVVLSVGGKEMYLDGYLKSNLDDLKKAIDMNWDGVGFYCGYEGDGKTTKAAQDCFYMDPTINLDRCVFTPNQFIKAVETAGKNQAILFDESHAAFSARNWRNVGQSAILSMLTRIRKRNLFIAVVSPTFFDLNRYVIIHRSRYMIYVRASGLERGFFSFFDRERKHELYVLGKKTESMNCVKPNFIGKFTKFFPFDTEAYEAKKDAAEKEMMKDFLPKEKVDKFFIRFQGLVKYLHDDLKLSLEKIAEITSLRCINPLGRKEISEVYHGIKANEYDTPSLPSGEDLNSIIT